jgi:hypothetical protein
MGYSFQGLSLLAKDHGIDLSKLNVGEFVLFVNTKKTSFKLYTANNTICYVKMPGNRRVDLRVIQDIPKYFNGSSLDYNKALTNVLLKEIGFAN